MCFRHFALLLTYWARHPHHILKFIWLLATYVQKTPDFTQRTCNLSILNDISNGISCSGEADEYLKEAPQWKVQGADGQLSALSKAQDAASS